MSSDTSRSDFKMVSIGGAEVGMSGLNAVFESLRDKNSLSAEEVGRLLLEKARKQNYIPSSPEVEADYRKALMREFKKFLGEESPDEEESGIRIRVLGPGCPRCHMLEQEVMAVLAELGVSADLQHVTDMREIAKFGVVGTPALIINKEVKSVGRVPSRKDIKKWLLDSLLLTGNLKWQRKAR